jgi:hypothetical protein
MDQTALAPQRRNFNLRKEDPANAIVTSITGPTQKKESKRSRLSRLFKSSTPSSTPASRASTQPTAQNSILLNLPSPILSRILFYTLDLPQNISLNFPYSALPEHCAFHLSSTPPPPVFSTCRALRKAAQQTFFQHTTFNLTFLAGGPTAHFWLKHDWQGHFVGPSKAVRNVLGAAQRVEIVLAAPSHDPGNERAGMEGNVRLGVEKEDADAVRKCLAVALAYVGGRKVGKNAGRELGKQVDRKVGALRTGEGGGRESGLGFLRVVLSKRDAVAVVTKETFDVLDMVGGVKVDGQVEVVLECRDQNEQEKARIQRRTGGVENALSESWPNRKDVLSCKSWTNVMICE